jgi:hypothetical protein
MNKNIYTYLYWCFYSMVRKRAGDTSHQRAAVLFSISQFFWIVIIAIWTFVLLNNGEFKYLKSFDFRVLFAMIMLIIIGINYWILLRENRYIKINNFYIQSCSKRKAGLFGILIIILSFALVIASGIALSKTINGW